MPPVSRPPSPAPIFGRPQLAALCVLALFSWLVWTGSSPAEVVDKAPAVPTTLGPWRGKSVEVTKRAVQILETEDVALMEYRMNEEPPVWFARVAGFGNRAAFHPPELCYVGSHFEILERGQVTVSVDGRPRKIMRLVISQDDEQFEAWYWFTANDRVTPNYYQQQLWLVLDSIRGKPMSGTLVRISTRLDEPKAAKERLLAFVSSFEAYDDAITQHDS